jgi:hypothetical protein
VVLYSDAVRQFMRTRDWPDKLQWEVREKESPLPHLYLIFFRDNWLTLNFQEQVRVTNLVKEVMATLWANDIPCYLAKEEEHGS